MCGEGMQHHHRICVNGEFGDLGCQGEESETRTCQAQACASWASWTMFTGCSVSCGGGVQTRQRECFRGNAGEAGCEGSTMDMSVCNTQVS